MKDDAFIWAQLSDPATQERAFALLVKTYGKRLYAHIRGIVISHDDTNDVLQNTFIKVFRHIDSFKGDSKLYTWLYRIATNESLTFLEQKSRKSGVSIEQLQVSEFETSGLDNEMDGEAIAATLQKALLQLPAKQQLVFRMKYFDELTYEEIAEITGTTVGALKASYHHAVRKIEDFIRAL
ncbi:MULTISPECIES: sigma-70 family RNA polymerase sigma factor [Flavobacterium]|uniref:RNA polymerase subunit sigma-70 n=1 Tax=Flavobacterium aurantiibacter TaxID=2023067 RepID=A0A256A682_9FLAO|nr:MULTISPECIES: sigma-70 family RNA polymerase sigma factor [Flavobacterium]OYQ49276.1 RNA polymerase subunit sigma-70 [Flavobacterium aurantiibacter]